MDHGVRRRADREVADRPDTRVGLRRSGGLDRGDLELEGDFVADQDAAGLERGVPGDAVVLAVDDRGALEPDPQVAERVSGRALELERDRDRVGDTPMVRSPVSSRVVAPAWRTLVAMKVISGYSSMARKSLLQVGIALLVAGVDAGRLDGQLAGRLGQVSAVEDRVALEVVERAADLGDHRVPGDEPDTGVGRVDDVVSGQVGQGGGDGAGSHALLLRSWESRLISDVSHTLKRNLGDMSTIPE